MKIQKAMINFRVRDISLSSRPHQTGQALRSCAAVLLRSRLEAD